MNEERDTVLPPNPEKQKECVLMLIPLTTSVFVVLLMKMRTAVAAVEKKIVYQFYKGERNRKNVMRRKDHINSRRTEGK